MAARLMAPQALIMGIIGIMVRATTGASILRSKSAVARTPIMGMAIRATGIITTEQSRPGLASASARSRGRKPD